MCIDVEEELFEKEEGDLQLSLIARHALTQAKKMNGVKPAMQKKLFKARKYADAKAKALKMKAQFSENIALLGET